MNLTGSWSVCGFLQKLAALVKTATSPALEPLYVDRWRCDVARTRARCSVVAPSVRVEHLWVVEPRREPTPG
jgi:hypothetical protein